MENTGNNLGWAWKLGGVGSQVFTRAGQKVLAKLMEYQIWWLPAGSVGERVHQRNNSLCQHFCLRESCLPPALALMPNYSVPPSYVSPCVSPHVSSDFQAAAPALELRGTESKLVHAWALWEELPGIPETLLSLTLNPHWFLHPEVMGTSLSGTGTLGWGA